jgi:hypothetical protein
MKEPHAKMGPKMSLIRSKLAPRCLGITTVALEEIGISFPFGALQGLTK